MFDTPNKYKAKKYNILSRFPGLIGKVYSQKLLRLFSYHRFYNALQECNGLVCIDIGANIGIYTNIMAQHAKHVYAYEPDPHAYKILSEITTKYQNITLSDCAIGDDNKTIKLYRSKGYIKNPLSSTIASTVYISNNSDIDNYIEVNQISIKNIILDIEQEIGILKIDAEGAEVPILEMMLDNCLLMSKIRYIFIETHERLYPKMRERYEILHREVLKYQKPVIDMYWH